MCLAAMLIIMDKSFYLLCTCENETLVEFVSDLRNNVWDPKLNTDISLSRNKKRRVVVPKAF